MGGILLGVLGALLGLLVLAAYVVWLHRRLAAAPDLPTRWRRAVAAVLALGVVVFVVGAALLGFVAAILPGTYATRLRVATVLRAP